MHFGDCVFWHSTVIRFLEKSVNVDDLIDTLYKSDGEEVLNGEPHFVHLDITPSVRTINFSSCSFVFLPRFYNHLLMPFNFLRTVLLLLVIVFTRVLICFNSLCL